MSRVVSVILATWLVASCGSTVAAQAWDRYLDGYHGPYRGRVVDAETKQPIAGAAVVAVWSREKIYPLHSSTIFYAAREVLSQDDGTFVLHAKELEETAPRYTLRPTFVIFFPGYGAFPGHQAAPRGFIGGIFEGVGATIELPKLEAKDKRLDVVRGLPPSVPDEMVPNLLRLVNIERVNLGLQPMRQRSGK